MGSEMHMEEERGQGTLVNPNRVAGEPQSRRARGRGAGRGSKRKGPAKSGAVAAGVSHDEPEPMDIEMEPRALDDDTTIDQPHHSDSDSDTSSDGMVSVDDGHVDSLPVAPAPSNVAPSQSACAPDNPPMSTTSRTEKRKRTTVADKGTTAHYEPGSRGPPSSMFNPTTVFAGNIPVVRREDQAAPSWYIRCPVHTTHRSCTKSMTEGRAGNDKLVVRKLMYWLLQGFSMEQAPGETPEQLRRRHLTSVVFPADDREIGTLEELQTNTVFQLQARGLE